MVFQAFNTAESSHSECNTDHCGYSCSTHLRLSRLIVGRAGAAGSQNGAFAISLLAVAALHPSALLDFVAAWAD